MFMLVPLVILCFSCYILPSDSFDYCVNQYCGKFSYFTSSASYVLILVVLLSWVGLCGLLLVVLVVVLLHLTKTK